MKKSVIDFWYPENKLLGFTRHDGTIFFYNIVDFLIQKNTDIVLVDVGCGRGEYVDPSENKAAQLRASKRNFKNRVKKVVGIDVDEAARENPTLDEFYLIKPDEDWPLEDSSCDMVICDYVVEHINNPTHFFSQISRILKTGGYVCIRTTNKFGYVGLAASLIPNSLHAKILQRIQDNRKAEDVFPTVYKCNTPSQLKKKLVETRFRPYVFTHESEPAYLNFSSIAYSIGVLYQKLVPGIFKHFIFAFGQKE